MSKIFKHFIEDLEFEYEYHPRIFWISFLVFMFIFLILQSYIAEPRSFQVLLKDCWDLGLLFIPLIIAFWSRKIRNLLIFGILFLVIFLGCVFSCKKTQ